MILGHPARIKAQHNMDLDADKMHVLPSRLRTRLYDLFGQIELEFEKLYAEKVALEQQVNFLNERLEQATGVASTSKVEPQGDGHESADGATAWKQSVKKSGSQFSQKLKHTYKTSTSKIVSSFRTASTGCSLVREYRGHRDGVWEVNTSKTDPHLIGTASADHSARLWWIESGTCVLQYLGHSGSVNSVRFHPTQDLVVTSSGDQTVHIWNAHVNKPSHIDIVKNLSSEDELDGSEREECEGFDSSDDKHEPTYIRQPSKELTGHTGVVIAADWMNGGSRIISASWDRSAILYDTETGEIVNTLVGHDSELTNVCAHTSQPLVVTSSKDTTFRLWDFRDPAMAVNVFQGHTQQITSAVFAGSDKIASGSDDRTVKVWDLKNMRCPLTTIRTDAAVNRLAVHPTHKIMAIPHDNRHIRLYDLNGVRTARLPRNNRQGHSRMVCAAAWSERDAATCNLFSCGFDRQVFGWSINMQIKE